MLLPCHHATLLDLCLRFYEKTTKNLVRDRVCHSDPWTDPTRSKSFSRWPADPVPPLGHIHSRSELTASLPALPRTSCTADAQSDFHVSSYNVLAVCPRKIVDPSMTPQSRGTPLLKHSSWDAVWAINNGTDSSRGTYTSVLQSCGRRHCSLPCW